MIDIFKMENSYEYLEYKKICSIISDDKDILDRINEIKMLQNKSIFLEYNNDLEFLEVEKEIENKVMELNSNPKYIEYLEKMKEYNEHISCR